MVTSSIPSPGARSTVGPSDNGSPRVAVVGSANLDIVIELDAPPAPGQTVLGTGYSEHGGGKGHNQAIASARLTTTLFIGALGSDAAGDLLADNMRSRGVRVEHVQRSLLPSGRAFITLTPDAENSIVVIAGASSTLTGNQVAAALAAAQPAVVVAQQEISAEAVVAAAAWAIDNGRRFLLNASPVRPVPSRVLAAADPLIVNADEARDILKVAADADADADAGADAADADATASADAVVNVAEAVAADSSVDPVTGEGADVDPERGLAQQLLAISGSVIVTAGKRGVYFASRGTPVQHVDAQQVEAVDTTGAGDEFAGTVAVSLALGGSLRIAAERASEASAHLVQLPRADR